MVEIVNRQRLPFYRSLIVEEGLTNYMRNKRDQLICSGALIHGKPVGIVIASIKKKWNIAEIVYIHVHDQFKRYGVGSLLLCHLEKQLLESSCRLISASFINGIEGSDGLEKFLSANQFDRAETSAWMHHVKLDEGMLSIPWMSKVKLPNYFSILSWQQLSAKDRVILLSGKNRWYPEAYSPFQCEEKINLDLSFGLKFKDEVIGWFIAYRTVSNQIEYGTMFIKRRFQQLGIGLALIKKAVETQLTNPAYDCHVFFRVGVNEQRFLSFLKKRIEPYVFIDSNEIVKMEKWLNFHLFSMNFSPRKSNKD